jgi:RNA polymerase sigma-70 factor, ECF subfamily
VRSDATEARRHLKGSHLEVGTNLGPGAEDTIRNVISHAYMVAQFNPSRYYLSREILTLVRVEMNATEAIDPFWSRLVCPADDHVCAECASDACLVHYLQRGSQEALACLYHRYGAAVLAAAARTSRDSWMAAEVVQETFLTLWNKADQFDASRGGLPAWLMTIARNRAVDYLRAAGRHERALAFSAFGHAENHDGSTAEWLASYGELIGAAGAEPGPEVALSRKEARVSIDSALASLAPAERRVIDLAFRAGLSQSEIAATLRWPLGTVKTRTRRAFRHLRDRLGETPTIGLRSGDSLSAQWAKNTASVGPGHGAA